MVPQDGGCGEQLVDAAVVGVAVEAGGGKVQRGGGGVE